MRGDAGEHGKDATLCLHCRGPKPPSLGTKPRKFCCDKCCRQATSLRNKPPQPWPPLCQRCGSDTGQVRRPGRRRRLCGECREAEKVSARALKPRYRATPEERSCPTCKSPFTVASRAVQKQYCSRSCAGRSPAMLEMLRRRGESRKGRYSCLCCGSEFTKRKYASGASSCQKKYCSRECAFEARRRRLPAAVDTRRRGGLTQSLVSWFLSWGDDVYPIITKCKCGQVLKQRKGKPPPRCWHCEERRPCRRCGCELPDERQKYDTLCCSCRADHDAESLARKRRRARLEKSKVGRNNRKRCRYYGVPYTPIKLRDIYERDNWTCQACGCALRREWDSNDPARCRTIDHIIPLSAGPGSPGHVPSNVRACCWSCNTAKGDSFEPASTQSLH